MDNIERIVVIHSPNSTRAKKFNRVNNELRFIAEPRSIKILDIVLDDLPYYQALKLIYKTIQDGDLIIAAGGDGVHVHDGLSCLKAHVGQVPPVGRPGR